MADSMRKHKCLGRVNWNETLKSWECEFELRPATPIRFAMVVEAEWAGMDPLLVLDEGARYLTWAAKVEPSYRERIVDDLLDLYNRSWAEESGQGPLTRAQFISEFTPSSITLYHNGNAEWMYDCGPIFCGHSINFLLGRDKVMIGKVGLFG